METSSLQQHALAHKSYKPFKCHICICFFAQKVALQCHMKRHERQKPFRRYQNSSSIKKSGVMQPKRTNHLTKSLREDKTVQIFRCKKCRSSFPETFEKTCQVKFMFKQKCFCYENYFISFSNLIFLNFF